MLNSAHSLQTRNPPKLKQDSDDSPDVPSVISIQPERKQSIYKIHQEEDETMLLQQCENITKEAAEADNSEMELPTPTNFSATKHSISVERRPTERFQRQKNFREKKFTKSKDDIQS